MTRDDVIAAARSQLGVPFRHQGRLAGQCLDCSGLIAHVATQLGVIFTDYADYGRTPNQGLLKAAMDAQPCLDIVTDKQPGDIFLIKFLKEPNHLALFTGSTIIHSYSTVGRVCEHAADPAWLRRVVTTYRFKGIE